MFITRFMSGAVLVAVLLAVGITGGNVLWAFSLLVSLIGIYEFYKVFQIEKTLGIPGYLMSIFYYVGILKLDLTHGLGWLAVYFMIIAAIYVLKYPKYKTEDLMASVFGVLYLPVMLSYMYQTRMLSDGLYFVWLVFLCSWGCDTCAYCVGVLIGKHKLAPVLSPKKSIEGAVGGVVGAALLGVIYAAAVGSCLTMTGAMWKFPLICGIGAVISQFGDLIASGIKRQHGIKDYGWIIPGHGGILDRFDSVIFTAPIIYLLAQALL